MVPVRAVAVVLVLMSLASIMPAGDAVAEAALPAAYDDIFASDYLPQAVKEVDDRHQGTYALVYYAFGYMEARRNDWSSASSGDPLQLLSPEFTFLMAADAKGRSILDVGAALTTWGTCTYAELGAAVHEYPTGDPAFWTVKVWSQAGERAWRQAPEHRPLAGHAMDYSAANLAKIKALLVQQVPVVVNTYGLAGANQNGFLDDDHIVSSKELVGISFSHYQTIIGYDDLLENDGDKGAVRVMSSYGANFGERGSFWITYAALERMAALHANDFTPYIDDSFLYYVDMAGAPPTALLVWEYDYPPTLDCTMEIALVSQDGNQLATPLRPFTGSRWYGHTHHFPRFMCLDISTWSYTLQRPDALLRMDQATTAGWVGTSGSIGCLLIELYDDYDSGERTPPASVSGQSIDHLLWTPFRVYNDLAFTNTVPIPVAADAPGQVFMSSGSWTFYGIPEAGSLGGSCLRSPDSAFWEETRLETAVIGPGSVSFRWRAAADGYLGGIEFRVDGSRISRLVGTTDWIEVNVTIAEGRHSIAWASNRWDEGPTNTLDDFYFLDAIRVSSADDMLEENDEASRASALADGGHGLVCADADWFALQLNKGDGFRLELTTSAHTGRLQFFLRTPGGGEREAENMGSMQVLEMRDAFDYIRVLVCVRPTGMEIGAYSLHVAYDRVVDKGALSTLRIEGGAAIDTEENARFSGTATISWENAWATAADLLLICSWGDHSQSYSIYAGAVAPGNSSGSIEFADIQAPACAGTYWMFLVYRGGVTPEQLASSSFDNGGVVDWNDGDDIAGQGADAVPGIRSEGRIWLRCLGANGAVYRMPVPCAVLQVSVADITPPVTSVTIRGEVGDGLWYRSLVEITLAAQDPSGVQKIMYRIDDGGWQTYAGPFRIAEDGSHRIACSATDGLDHVEEASSFPFFIDQAPPQLACTVAGKTGENGWHTGPVSLTPLFGDETSGCRARYRIDGGPWMELSGAVLLEIPGWHRVDMSCLDGAGNAASLSQEVGIDLAGPRTTVTLDGERLGAQWFGSAVRAAIAALDLDSGAASTMVRLDGGEWLRVDGTFLIAEAGQHVLECLAIDAAGNLGETAAVRVAIDLLPPLVTFCGRPDGVSLIALDTPEVVLNGTDDVGGLSFFIRVDEGGWQSLRGGMTRITAGQHHVQAYATDAAGRIGPISSTILVYDPEDPTAVLTVDGRAGELGWYLGPVRLSVNASDAQPGRVTASLQVNGRAVDPAGFLLDSPGWHDIVYMARDLAGNTFGPVAVHLGVDLQAPLLICERSGTRGANGWYVGEVRLNITVLEDASGVQLLEYSLDGGGWERADGGVIVRHDGIHTVQLRCRDRAGNAATLSMEVPIDAGGPLIPYSEGEELHLKDRSLALRFKMGDWCSGLSSVKVSVDKGEPMLLDVATPTLMLEQLSDGRHLLEIEARDCAGNIASRTVTIDMNTDPLDPEGPYGILPLAAIVCLLAIAVAMIIRWGCRYR